MKTKSPSPLFRSSAEEAREYIMHMLVIGALMLTIVSALLASSVSLYHRMQRNAQAHAAEISRQLTGHLSSRLESYELYIQELADSLSRMPQRLLTGEFLEKKRAALQLDELSVLSEDGSWLPACTDAESHEAWLAEHPDLGELPHLSYIAQQELLFTAPIQRESGPDQVLVGAWKNDTMQQMLRELGIGGQAACCIVDQSGKLIVAPEDLQPFHYVAELPYSAKSVNLDAVQKAAADITEWRTGVVSYEAADGQDMTMTYDFLGVSNWVLLTILPQYEVVGEDGHSLLGYMAAIMLAALGCGGMLAYILRSYHKSLRRVEQVTFTDILTGGYNERGFQFKGEQLLRQTPNIAYTMLFLNIRGFRTLNEQYGVESGNLVLRGLHELLRVQLVEGELLSRTEGDHFFLLLQNGTEAGLAARLDDMMQSLEGTRFGEVRLQRSQLSQGAYIVPRFSRQDLPNFLILQDRAKIASTYQKKGDECCFYNEELQSRLDQARVLDADFDRALRDREFLIYLQPKVHPGGDRSCGAEALVRWQHPDYGMIYPLDFIPLLEKSGRICKLDAYMFEEICRLLSSRMEKGELVFPISVNLSRANMRSRDLAFLDQFTALKRKYHIPDNLIELELTETLMFESQQIGFVTRVVRSIREHGFLCSMDDFGSGYSSLSLLKDLKVSSIKLDRAFFLQENERTWVIVSKFIELVHELGITVVAEGIEEAHQVQRLRQLGCDMIQGYYYAKPLPAADCIHWMDAYNTKEAAP